MFNMARIWAVEKNDDTSHVRYDDGGHWVNKGGVWYVRYPNGDYVKAQPDGAIRHNKILRRLRSGVTVRRMH